MDTHRDARPGAVARPPRRAWHARARARTHTHTHTHSLTHSPYARPQEGALGKFSFSALMIAVAVGAPAALRSAALLWAGRRYWRRRLFCWPAVLASAAGGAGAGGAAGLVSGRTST